jgi:isocitrate dehydrogenase kinase/phosphatase
LLVNHSNRNSLKHSSIRYDENPAPAVLPQRFHLRAAGHLDRADRKLDPPTWRSYYPNQSGLRAAVKTIFTDFGWSRPFADIDRDVDYIMRAALSHLGGEWPDREANFQLQVLSSAYYRNKAAYVIGKAINGHQEYPFMVSGAA